MVGAVIVHNGKIIGEGYHRKFGEPHAEVNAVNAVEDKDLAARIDIIRIARTVQPCRENPSLHQSYP